MGKRLVAFGFVAASAVGAFAGALTEAPSIDLSDVNLIFGAIVAAGAVLYGIRKAKSLLGA